MKMKTLAVKGNWNIVKGKVKQTLARWTEDSLQFSEGKENELTGRIQKRSDRDLRRQPAEQCCGGCNH